jgi:hypothetical protein
MTFEGSKTPLSEACILVTGHSESTPDDGGGLSCSRQIARKNPPKRAVPKPLGESRCLVTALCGQCRSRRVTLDEPQHIPGALTMARQPQSSTVIVAAVHNFKNADLL